MPAPDGWHVLSQTLTTNPEQRVQMLSGHALDVEARERGAKGLLRKPFSGVQLIETVAAALDDAVVTDRDQGR
jgi:FixJ family two-component response regulator